jgi:transcriptional regulatory protein GAL4
LIAHHLPGINVEEALRSSTPLRINGVQSFTSDPPEAPTSSREPEAREEEPENEALPSEASGFDWRETAVDLNELADGMASLSLDPSGKGYLGTCSHLHLAHSLMLMFCIHQDQLPALWC